jgi:uncharacterized protein YecA (UPF0149 family)
MSTETRGKVIESIWDGPVVVPLADVQHIEKLTNGIWVITKHTRWDMEADTWSNPIYIGQDRAESFMRAWCCYRHELEYDTLMDPTPQPRND